MESAQRLARTDIAQAASLLEAAGLFGDSDFAEGFDIRTNELCSGSKNDWKGVASLRALEAKNAVIGMPLTISKEELVDQVVLGKHASSPRGVIFFKNDDRSLHCFRAATLPATGTEYFDKRTQSWRASTEDDLLQLRLGPTDRVIALGGEPPVPPVIGTSHGTPTPHGPSAGFFYHEIQEGSLCGLHAGNAFCGFSALRQAQVQDEVLRDMGTSPYNVGEEVDVSDGLSPVSLALLLSRVLPEREACRVVELRKTPRTGCSHAEMPWSPETETIIRSVPSHIDRVVIGYTNSIGHYVAARRHPETGKWHLIDSLEDSGGQQIFKDLEGCVLKSALAKGHGCRTPAFLIY